jgi:secreted PhoX family phosphatase
VAFARLEGCWWGDNSVYFNATSGGAVGAGQVWQYRPTSVDGGQLVLIFESPSTSVLESPDNICVSPRGGIVLCEDGGGQQFLRGLTPQGQIFDFVATRGSASELAGAVLQPRRRRPLLQPAGLHVEHQHGEPRRHLRHLGAVGQRRPVSRAAALRPRPHASLHHAPT